MPPKKQTGNKPPGGRVPFAKGNKHGNRWKPGESGNPKGRPPKIGSPRSMLKRYAEKVAPEKLRTMIAELYPELSKEEIAELSWAEVIALKHLTESAAGDMGAIALAYKQIDDSGVDIGEIRFADEVEDAAAELARDIASLAAKRSKRKTPR